MAFAFLGLGSNLDNPNQQIANALRALNNDPKISVLRNSSLYETKPYGPVEQENFVNCVAKVSTQLPPEKLLEWLLTQEKHQDRQRKIHWGPRTIDLDLLCYENLVMQSNNLTLPHPGILERDFVLVPLAEIEPEFKLANGLTVSRYLSQTTLEKNILVYSRSLD